MKKIISKRGGNDDDEKLKEFGKDVDNLLRGGDIGPDADVEFEDVPREKKPEKKPEIKKYTEDELRKRLQEIKKNARPKVSTTVIVTAISTLDKMKRNTDFILLILHTLFCLTCGAILAVGFFAGLPWLKAGGGLTGFVAFITLMLSYLNPKGDLANFLNRDKDEILEQLNKLSQQDFNRLYQEMGNTEFFRTIKK